MREIMIDLDNTLVNFTQMLFNHIEEKFGYHFEENDVVDYDFSVLFCKHGCSREEIYKFFESIYSDETLYTKQLVLSKYFDKILEYIKIWKDLDYKIVCHTKVSSDQMRKSKEEMFDRLLFKNVFDNIIIEYIQGKKVIFSTKDSHYDIIVDDSPYIIEDYLKNNKEGKVYLPVTEYNKFLLDKEEYKDRILML